MIRKDFVKRKIALIQDDLSNLTMFSAFSLDDITKDSIKQAAVERFLERIINRAIWYLLRFFAFRTCFRYTLSNVVPRRANQTTFKRC